MDRQMDTGETGGGRWVFDGLVDECMTVNAVSRLINRWVMDSYVDGWMGQMANAKVKTFQSHR